MMKMKKTLPGRRLLSLLLTLTLCAALIPAPAMAEGGTAENLWMSVGDSYLDRAPQLQSMAAIDNTLYLLSYEGLYVCHPGEGEPVLLAEPSLYAHDGEQDDIQFTVERIFAKDGILYGLTLSDGTVTQLVDAAGTLAIQKTFTLDFSVLLQSEEEGMSPDVRDIAVQGNKLYLLTNYYGTDRQQGLLYELELTEGAKAVQKKPDSFSAICAYKDGLLLAVPFPNYRAETVYPGELCLYDPAADSTQSLCPMPETEFNASLAYDGTTVYCTLSSTVYALAPEAAEAVTCAFLPEQSMGNAMSALSGGMLAVAGYSGLYLRTPSLNAAAADVLTISGEYGSNVHMAVVAEHPELSIRIDSDYLSDMEQFTNSMVSGDAAVDVLSMAPSYQPVEELIRKGYATDLSAFPEIMAFAQRMNPDFLAPYTADGKLYAVPVEMHAQMPTVNMELWTETLGLTEDDLPATFPELLDFFANYTYDYGYDHEDINLLDCWDMRSELLTMLLQYEIAYQQREGAATYTFQTPRFQKLLSLLDSIDDSEISMSKLIGSGASDAQFNEFYSKPILFSLYNSVRGPDIYNIYNEEQRYLVLTLDDGLEPVLPADLTVMLINPRSQHMAAAGTYVSSYLSHMNAAYEQVTLFTDNTGAVPNENFDEEVAVLKKQIADAENALATAAEENKAEMKDQLDWMKKALEEQDSRRYLVKAEDNARFQAEIAPYLYPARQNPITTFGDQASSSVQSLLNQYVEKAINADAFLKELENRVRLIQLENQ